MSFLTPEHLVERLYIKLKSRVADFGCGKGIYTIALSHAVGNEGKVYAVDIHRESLQTLETTLNKMGVVNVETVWADAEESTFIDAYSLDAAVVSNVLFMTEKKSALIEEVARVLAPGGTCLCVEWSGSHHGIGPHKEHVLSESEAEKLFTDAGFRVGERLPAGEYHYSFVATKL